ncbi:MAG TPA: NAD(P)-dependent oxidoreductase [Actinophytocola sp.]|uniref:NAD(P)-dependent oxidoreductase n=1 Tax=Actinophytocola sp. TaxID=1872138 RepID=UPI002DDD2973|nr:NAD(P)-dependent oxidoreductase [Actinophytocola sp.]HEV2782155.1 NAD(P)-dependent oxidoreductase [Actinophytocola sp.]
MAITVLVPDDFGMAALSGIDGVELVRFDLDRPLPPEAERAEVLIPGVFAQARTIDLIHRLPNLRLLQLLSAGAELWIGRLPDGVMVSTSRGAHGGSTAEWVIGALLAIYRELFEFERHRQARHWAQHVTDTLQGKRILVVGAGDLGRQLKRRLDAFDAHATMVGYRARDGVHGREELPDLIGGHDAVVVMVPVTAETTGMVDGAFLARMRDGAVLVNAARGVVVDTDALLAELTSGRLRAALDVTDPEPLPPDHPLWTAPGLLLTPHVAGAAAGHRERSYAIAAAEIARFAAGTEPENLVRGDY